MKEYKYEIDYLILLNNKYYYKNILFIYKDIFYYKNNKHIILIFKIIYLNK